MGGAAASVCCRRNDDRDAAEDYLASLTARAALVREHGSRHWRLVDGVPLHVLVERCHLTKPGTFRALKNAARLVEHACLLREQAGPPTLRTLTVLTEQDSPKLPLKRFLEPDRIVGAPVDVASDKFIFTKVAQGADALKVTTNRLGRGVDGSRTTLLSSDRSFIFEQWAVDLLRAW